MAAQGALVWCVWTEFRRELVDLGQALIVVPGLATVAQRPLLVCVTIAVVLGATIDCTEYTCFIVTSIALLQGIVLLVALCCGGSGLGRRSSFKLLGGLLGGTRNFWICLVLGR